jgi:hypothetical protein
MSTSTRVRASAVLVLAMSAFVLVPLSVSAQSDGGSGTAGVPFVDPCQIIPASEASALAGATFDSGVPLTSEGGSVGCVYGANTANVLTVVVAQAPDAATAQAEWANYEAKAQSLFTKDLPPGVALNFSLADVSDLPADRATLAQGSASFAGRTINGSACYLLKGTSFVAFSDLLLGQAAPSSDALEGEAQTVLGRLP